MAGILSGFLSPALTVASQAAGTYQGAEAKIAEQKRARDQQQILQAYQLARQQKEDALKNALSTAQAHHLGLEDRKLQSEIDTPKPSPYGPEARSFKEHEIDYTAQHGYHPPQSPAVEFLPSQDPATGQTTYSIGDKRAKTITPTGSFAKQPIAKGASATDKMAQDHYGRAKAASDALDKFGGTVQSHGQVTNWIMGHNPFDHDLQQANQAGEEFVTLIAPILNKGRTTHVELEQVRKTYVPLASDDAANIKQKAEARAALLQQYVPPTVDANKLAEIKRRHGLD